MTKTMAQSHPYIDAFHAMRRGIYQPSDIRNVIRYQARFAGTGARAAGSPIVDEDRERWRLPSLMRDVVEDHDSPLSYASETRWESLWAQFAHYVAGIRAMRRGTYQLTDIHGIVQYRAAWKAR
jgi:hypothetical protein